MWYRRAGSCESSRWRPARASTPRRSDGRGRRSGRASRSARPPTARRAAWLVPMPAMTPSSMTIVVSRSGAIALSPCTSRPMSSTSSVVTLLLLWLDFVYTIRIHFGIWMDRYPRGPKRPLRRNDGPRRAPNTTASTITAPARFIASRTPPSYQGNSCGYSADHQQHRRTRHRPPRVVDRPQRHREGEQDHRHHRDDGHRRVRAQQDRRDQQRRRCCPKGVARAAFRCPPPRAEPSAARW